jgi:hypothetical protein
VSKYKEAQELKVKLFRKAEKIVDKRYRDKRFARFDDVSYRMRSKHFAFEDKTKFIEFQIEDILLYFKGSNLS